MSCCSLRRRACLARCATVGQARCASPLPATHRWLPSAVCHWRLSQAWMAWTGRWMLRWPRRPLLPTLPWPPAVAAAPQARRSTCRCLHSRPQASDPLPQVCSWWDEALVSILCVGGAAPWTAGGQRRGVSLSCSQHNALLLILSGLLTPTLPQSAARPVAPARPAPSLAAAQRVAAKARRPRCTSNRSLAPRCSTGRLPVQW